MPIVASYIGPSRTRGAPLERLRLEWSAAVVRHVASYRQGASCRYDAVTCWCLAIGATPGPDFVFKGERVSVLLRHDVRIRRFADADADAQRAGISLRAHNRGVIATSAGMQMPAIRPGVLGLRLGIASLLSMHVRSRRARPTQVVSRTSRHGLGGHMGKESRHAVRRSAPGISFSCAPGVPMTRMELRAFGDCKVSCEASSEVRLVGLKCGGGYAISSAFQLPRAVWHVRMDGSLLPILEPDRRRGVSPKYGPEVSLFPRALLLGPSREPWTCELRDGMMSTLALGADGPCQHSGPAARRCGASRWTNSGPHRTFQRQ